MLHSVNREDWLSRPDFPPTLPSLLHRVVQQYGKNTLIVAGDRRLTFAEADAESARLAKGLIALGVGKATRVGLLMGNSTDWLTAYLAITRVGAIAVLISTLYQRKDLAWVLRHADIHTLLMADHYLSHDYVQRMEDVAPELRERKTAALLLASLPYLRNVVVWGDNVPAWAIGAQALLDLGASDRRIDDAFLAALEAEVTPADLAIMMYTSGSTADPKGILHTHGAMVRRLGIHQHIRRLAPDDRTLIVGPFCWAAGFIALHLAMISGSSVICPATPKIDDILTIMDRELPTELSAQPGMIRQLREHPRLSGGTLDPALTTLLDKRLNSRRSDQASRGLGMTETFGQHSIETRFDHVPDDKLEAFGRLVPDMERRLRNPETGQWAAPGEEGVLWVRGPNMMAGLYKKERHEAFDADGYYNTGDLCSIDADGYLYFKGRNTEMIKTSGANVAPREVEVALEAYPGVQEASVFGVVREGHDSIVTAVVVPRPGATIDPEALRKQMRQDVASFKVPKTIHVVASEDAPRTGSGKLHKPKLREMFSKPAA